MVTVAVQVPPTDGEFWAMHVIVVKLFNVVELEPLEEPPLEGPPDVSAASCAAL